MKQIGTDGRAHRHDRRYPKATSNIGTHVHSSLSLYISCNEANWELSMQFFLPHPLLSLSLSTIRGVRNQETRDDTRHFKVERIFFLFSFPFLFPLIVVLLRFFRDLDFFLLDFFFLFYFLETGDADARACFGLLL